METKESLIFGIETGTATISYKKAENGKKALYVNGIFVAIVDPFFGEEYEKTSDDEIMEEITGLDRWDRYVVNLIKENSEIISNDDVEEALEDYLCELAFKHKYLTFENARFHLQLRHYKPYYFTLSNQTFYIENNIEIEWGYDRWQVTRCLEFTELGCVFDDLYYDSL